MPKPDRSHLIASARAVLDEGAWCLLEVRHDVPDRRWEPRLVVLVDDPEAVADAAELELVHAPDAEARLVGCDRRTLRRAAAPAALDLTAARAA